MVVRQLPVLWLFSPFVGQLHFVSDVAPLLSGPGVFVSFLSVCFSALFRFFFLRILLFFFFITVYFIRRHRNSFYKPTAEIHIHSIMQSLAVLFLALAGTSIAAPAQDQSVGQHVPEVQGQDAPVVELPGFNHLARNATQDAVKVPADAAFDGTCEQITLGGHGKVGMTTLDGLCRNSAGDWWKTSLNLNECIGNVGGKLVYQAG